MRVSKQRLVANNDSKNKCRRLWDFRFEGELVINRSLSKSIEVNQSRSKSIKVDQSQPEADRKTIEANRRFTFFEALINFDRLDNHFD